MPLHTSIINNLLTGPLSLADLQTLTQVSLPTLRRAVQELSDNHWIRVVGQSEANGGRPAMLFGLDDSHYLMLGVHVQLPGLYMIVSDLGGHVLDEIELFQQVQPTPDQVVQAILDYALASRTRFAGRGILGIGIAAPGFTDPQSGDVIAIGRVPGWQNFPICRRLEAALDLPVRIANDVDCMAFAEFQHTDKSLANNLAYIGFDEGVKVSMFLNGELYKGPAGNTGLIMSHFLRVPDVDISLEDQQHLMTITGVNHIFEQKLAALSAAEQERYAPMLDANYRERFGLILTADGHDFPLCDAIMTTLRQVLAAVVANFVYMIQPDHIIIGGLLSLMPEPLFTQLSVSIRDHLPPLFANRLHIEKGQFASSDSAAQGANYHFMESYLLRDDRPRLIR